MHARIFWLTAGMGVVVNAVAMAVILWMSSQLDRVTQDASVILVESALLAEQDRIATLTLDYAYWDAAYEWYIARDEEALFDNLGVSASVDGVFHALFFVAPDGTADYGYVYEVDGSDPALYPAEIGEALRLELDALPLSPPSTVGHLALYDGELTIFVAAHLRPTGPIDNAAASLPMLVGSIRLGPDDLASFGKALLLEDMQLLPSDDIVPNLFSAAQIRGVDDRVIANLVWRKQQPGMTLVRQAAPYLVTVAGFTLLISLLVARESKRQTEEYLVERTKARTDSLTALPNRTGLDDFAKSSRVRQSLTTGELAVIYVDLDKFKDLNDRYGHSVGDTALRITAERLRSALRDSDFVARVGGDEFICLVVGDGAREATDALIARITIATSAPLVVEGQIVPSSASIGVAFASPLEGWDHLIARADAAMYRAKNQSRDGGS